MRSRLASFDKDYRKLFSIPEIEDSTILQWFFGAMLFFFFVTFDSWIGSNKLTVEAAQSGIASCWPYFQNCLGLYFLHQLPYGYSQSTFYMMLYGVMLFIVWCMWRKFWSAAHAGLLVLWLWKAYAVFVLSFWLSGPYDYYHLALTAILLFVPYKEYFLKLCYVFMYFMSVTTKFDQTWTLGTYFTALKLGMPIFPGITTTFWTNAVIFMQTIGCWFLLSKRWVLQRLALVYFVIFHLYSGILVYYTYPSITLPSLLILFGPMYSYTPTPFSWKTLSGWSVILALALFQLLGFVVSPDRIMTMEGHRYGMYMFEANHQCVVNFTTYYSSNVSSSNDFTSPPGTPCNALYCLVQRTTTETGTSSAQTLQYQSDSAWNRCDPYEWYAELTKRCASDPKIQKIALQVDHSVNGGPFYEIVNTPNVCDLTYQPFSHNDWILTPPAAPIVGYPVENSYHY